MDDWMMYQLTGDERYIQAFRRKKALKAALMAGSLGGIGGVSFSIMASQVLIFGLLESASGLETEPKHS